MEGGTHGPGDVAPFSVRTCRVISGPALPNWQAQSIVASLELPFQWRGELVTYVTINPRYRGDTFYSIERSGGAVGVGRVRPREKPMEWKVIAPSGVEYWGVGILTVVKV